MSIKKTIPYSDYVVMCGLLSLARKHNARLADIMEQLETITGEGADPEVRGMGHCMDETYAPNPSADELLQRLEITVEPQPQANPTQP